MSKNNTQHALVPRLRFPEFRDAPCRSMRLGEVTEDASVRNGNKLDAVVVMGVFKGEGMLPMKQRLIANDISRYKVVEKDWFAYNPMRLNIGSIARWSGDESVLVSPDYVVFRCSGDRDQEIAPNYLDQFRHSDQWERFVTLSGDGSVRVRIYFKDLATLRISLPALPEQQKIAECLGSLDDLIAAEGRKLVALREHKKGLMQQLFPRKDETQPRLRFSEFRDAPDWEEATVGSRCTSFSGGTPNTTRKEFYGGTIPFIRSAEIGSDSTGLFLTEEGLNSSAAKMVTRGEVLVALYGANSGDVALSRVDGAINQAILCLRPEGSNAFLYHYLTQKKAWILATYLQGGQGNLSGDIVKSVSLRFPSPDEQETIADCLSALDARIAAQAEKLDSLCSHKRGLMQQLFPSPEPAKGGST